MVLNMAVRHNYFKIVHFSLNFINNINFINYERHDTP